MNAIMVANDFAIMLANDDTKFQTPYQTRICNEYQTHTKIQLLADFANIYLLAWIKAMVTLIRWRGMDGMEKIQNSMQ